VEQYLSDILNGKVEATSLVRGEKQSMRWNFRAAPAVETEIFIDNRSATRHTVVEIITQDRRDLLFWLSTAMHREELTIDLAKINTEGERVADVFYVTNRDGSKLDEEQVVKAERRVQATLAMIEGATIEGAMSEGAMTEGARIDGAKIEGDTERNAK
jgi:[protein-PII] uridylyltransferase